MRIHQAPPRMVPNVIRITMLALHQIASDCTDNGFALCTVRRMQSRGAGLPSHLQALLQFAHLPSQGGILLDHLLTETPLKGRLSQSLSQLQIEPGGKCMVLLPAWLGRRDTGLLLSLVLPSTFVITRCLCSAKCCCHCVNPKLLGMPAAVRSGQELRSAAAATPGPNHPRTGPAAQGNGSTHPSSTKSGFTTYVVASMHQG